ncbi:MAG: hypothetical protein FWG72_00905 [Oscillospiraceae bacterium]|nr:hypothetical protein [Oscillospiraceae bacterium]
MEASVVPMSELSGLQAAQVKGYETVVSINIAVGYGPVTLSSTMDTKNTIPGGFTAFREFLFEISLTLQHQGLFFLTLAISI